MNYALGTFQGGPDPNAPDPRDEIVQALMARMYGGDPRATAELANLGVINPLEDRGSYDPAIGDTMATGRESINPFSPDTAAFSTSQQTTGDRTFGNFSGNSFGNVGALTPGAMTAAGNAMGRSNAQSQSQYGSSTFNQPGAMPVTTTSILPESRPGREDVPVGMIIPGSAPILPTGRFSPMPGRTFVTPEDVPPEDVPPDVPVTPHIAVNKPSAPLPGRPGGATPGGGVSTGAQGGFGGGFGGGIDMAATGGYEGSASVGNTTGAAGFTSPGGGSGFGNVGGSQGSYGSYAGEAPSGFSAPSGGFSGFSATGGYDPGAFSAGFEAGAAAAAGMGTGGAEGGGGGLGGGVGGGGGGSDPGGSPGGVG